MSIRTIALSSVFFVFCSLSFAVGEEKLGVSLSAAQLGRYEKLDIDITGVGEFAKPMNPYEVKLDAILVTPSGKSIKVPGFAMHQTKPTGSDITPKYKPVGPWLWKIRYAPDETGTYKGTASLVVAGRAAKNSDPFEFKVVESKSKGFIRVSKSNPFAFQYADGSPYILIGQNLCWANDTAQAGRLARYTKWLDDMAANNCNYIRIWLGSRWSFGIEGDESKTFTEPYEYNEDAAALMDKVLALCEERGIAIKLCIGNNVDTYFKSKGGNYNVSSGKQFLTDPAAKKQWRALLRYCIARWGASTSIFAWELWNEMDHNIWGMGRQVADWSNEMCAYIKRLDPYRHPTTNSTGSKSRLFVLWNKPNVDFAQYHDYGGKGKNEGKPQYQVYAPAIADLRKAGKPVMLAECGLAQKQQKADAAAYAFHEALWIGFIAGGCGTGMHWWWDNAIQFHPKTHYPQYKHFAAFVSDLPVLKEPFPPIDAKASSENLKVYARGAGWGTICWVANYSDRWQRLVIDKKQPENVSGAVLTLPIKTAARYKIICFDPWTGRTLSEVTRRLVAGKNEVRLPDFKIDVAVKALRAADMPPAKR